MIKARLAHRDGTPIFFFGLTRENVERLQEGSSILVELRNLGVETGGQVIIHYADDVQSLMADLRQLDPELPDFPAPCPGQSFRHPAGEGHG